MTDNKKAHLERIRIAVYEVFGTSKDILNNQSYDFEIAITKRMISHILDNYFFLSDYQIADVMGLSTTAIRHQKKQCIKDLQKGMIEQLQISQNVQRLYTILSTFEV